MFIIKKIITYPYTKKVNCNYNGVMEYEQHPNLVQPVDMLKMLKETYVSSVIKNTNAELLWPTTDSDEAVEALIRNFRMVLDQAFGKNYLDEPATVNGIAYQADRRGNPTGTEVYFYGKELIYYGPTMQSIDDVPQIVIKFYDAEAYDDDSNPVETIYYMAPKDIEKFDITPTEKLIDIIAHHTVQSRRLLSSPDFVQAPVSIQHDILELVGGVFDEDVREYRHLLLEVKTRHYMDIYDGMPMSLVYSLFEPHQLDHKDQITLLGRYVSCQFPEIMDQPDKHFDSIHDLNLSDGVPCMIFRDEDLRVTYVVPSGAITEINVIEEFEET